MKKTVTLNPGESKVVGFTFIPSQIKSYVVNADGLSGSFRVVETPTAKFVVSNLVIQPTEVYIGETINISVMVTNISNIAGTYEVNCEVT